MVVNQYQNCVYLKIGAFGYSLIIKKNFNLKYIYNPTNKKPYECGGHG